MWSLTRSSTARRDGRRVNGPGPLETASRHVEDKRNWTSGVSDQGRFIARHRRRPRSMTDGMRRKREEKRTKQVKAKAASTKKRDGKATPTPSLVFFQKNRFDGAPFYLCLSLHSRHKHRRLIVKQNKTKHGLQKRELWRKWGRKSSK